MIPLHKMKRCFVCLFWCIPLWSFELTRYTKCFPSRLTVKFCLSLDDSAPLSVFFLMRFQFSYSCCRCILTVGSPKRRATSGVSRSIASSSPLFVQESSSGLTGEVELIPRWDIFARVSRLESIVFTKEDARLARLEMKEEARLEKVEMKKAIDDSKYQMMAFTLLVTLLSQGIPIVRYLNEIGTTQNIL